MAGTLRIYRGVFLTANGVDRRPGGSLTVPIKPVTVNAEFVDIDKEVAIEAGGVDVLWDYQEKIQFATLGFQCDGPLSAWMLVDTPVSDLDPLPSGDNPRWRNWRKNCHGYFELDEFTVDINPDPDIDIGTVSPTSIYPAAMDHPDTVTGRVYRIILKNYGASTVMYKRTLIN